jgi:hypothetical protein
MNNFKMSLMIKACPGKSAQAMWNQGFAYLWTLMLVALMGVGLVVASEIYSTTLRRDKERELIFIGREFRNAIGRYYESNLTGGQRQYPTSLESLLKDSRFPNARRYLRRIYTDPMTGKNEWGLVLVKGQIMGVHSLSDTAPIKQDNFEAAEATFRGKEKYSEWTFTYPPDLLLTAVANPAGTGSADNNIPSAKPTSTTIGPSSNEDGSFVKNVR